MSNHNPAAQMVRKMNRIVAITCVSLLVTATLSLADSSFFYSQDIGNSAESIGKGNIQGLGTTSAVIFGNPAALNTNCLGISVFNMSFMKGESNYYAAAAATRLTSSINIGAGFTQLGVDGIPKTDIDGANEFIQVGTSAYTNRKGVASVSVEYQKNQLIGINLVGYEKRIDTLVGRGFNVDIGTEWQPDDRSYVISASWHNILPTAVKYSTGENEDLVSQYDLAAVYRLTWFPDINVYGQLSIQNKPKLTIGKSIGMTYFLTPQKEIYLTSSLRDVVNLGKTRLTPSLGLVVNAGSVQLAYAFNTNDLVDQSVQHCFSVSWRQLDAQPLFKDPAYTPTLPE